MEELQENLIETEEYEVEVIEENPLAVIEKKELTRDAELVVIEPNDKKNKHKEKDSKKNKSKPNFDDEDYSAFYELALLRNITVSDIKDECCSFQIKTLMNNMGKVLVRYEVSEKEMDVIMQNARILGMNEVVVSPANLKACAKSVRKFDLENQKVTLLIDFPFGESSIENKLMSVKEGKKAGVDGITVTLPPNLYGASKKRALKKQLKKIKRSFRGDIGVAVSAQELTGEEMKNLLKAVAKTKLKHITFVFGAVSEEELISKVSFANKFKGKLKYKVLGNIETAVAVMNLFKLNADVILSPYTDDIAKELLQRFKVKSLKLK